MGPYRSAPTLPDEPRATRDRDVLAVLGLTWLTALACVVASVRSAAQFGGADTVAMLLVAFIPALVYRRRRA